MINENSTIVFKAPVKPVKPPPFVAGKIVVDGESKTDDATTKGSVEVKKGGKAVVEAAAVRTEAEKDYPAVLDFTSKGGVATMTNAGTVILKDKAWVRFTHTADDPLIGDVKGGGYFQQDDAWDPTKGGGPLLQIEAGCKITCVERAEVKIVLGSVELTEQKGTDGNPLAVQLPVTIQGSADAQFPNALVLDWTGKIGVGQGRSVPIPLIIEGQFDWKGEIELYADNTKYANDSVQVTKRVLVSDPLILPGIEEGDPNTVIHPKLLVAWFDAALAFPVPLPEGEGSWDLVTSGFTNAAQANPELDPIQGEPVFNPPQRPRIPPSHTHSRTRTRISFR